MEACAFDKDSSREPSKDNGYVPVPQKANQVNKSPFRKMEETVQSNASHNDTVIEKTNFSSSNLF